VSEGRLVPDSPRRGPGDHGSASAEFAIVVPVLIALLFLIVTLASVFFDQLQLQSAARDGARVGVVDINVACSTATTALARNDVGTVTCLITSDCNSGAVRVALTAAKRYSIPVIGSRVVELDATSSFVCPQ
jgi:Flp pilus assembly protein TadG